MTFDWNKFAFSTESSNRAVAENEIKVLYTACGLSLPNEFIWVKSPREAVKFAQLMKGQEVKNEWGKSVKDPIFNSFTQIYRRYVSTESRQDLQMTMGVQLFKDETILNIVTNNLVGEIQTNINGSFYGHLNYAMLKELHETIASKNSPYPKLRPKEEIFLKAFTKLSAQTSWIIPYEKKCILSERPIRFSINLKEELHDENEKALEWSDGYGFYYFDGIEIDEWIIKEPQKITVAKIRSQRNLEIRRLMIQKMTISKYLEECKAKTVDIDSIYVFKDGDDRCMPRALMVDDLGQKYLVGTDGSTDRVYYMNVHSDSNTCSEAHASICGFDESIIVANS